MPVKILIIKDGTGNIPDIRHQNCKRIKWEEPLYDELPINNRNSPSGKMFKRKMENIRRLAIKQPAIDFNLKDFP